MRPPRATTVVIGEVVVAAGPGGLERAEAIGLADGRVVSAGARSEVVDATAPGARVLDVRPQAVLPGLQDFHLHLVGMAHARLEVSLDDAASLDEVIAAVTAAAARLPSDAWVTGRGWREVALAGGDLARLDATTQGRPALLHSHDGHSAWASSTALRRAGIDRDTPEPAGGRI